MKPMKRLGVIAGDVGRGLVAGLAGTAMMTVVSTIEAKAQGRGASTAPAQAVETVLDVKPKDEQAEMRLSNLTHWAYGTAWGVPRGLLASVGLGEPRASAVHFGLVWGAALASLPALGIAPPPQKWGTRAIALDAGHHAVYAAATGLTYRMIARSS